MAPPASAISLACLAPFFLADREWVCVQAASGGLGHTPLDPGGLGNHSESPRETLGTLDQCREGKGRVDWEAKKAPGQGSAEERRKEALLPSPLPELQSPRASEPHMIGVSSPVLSGSPHLLSLLSISSVSSYCVIVSMEGSRPLTPGVWPGQGAERGVEGKELIVGSVGSPPWGWWGREGRPLLLFGRWAQPSLIGTLARKRSENRGRTFVSHLAWGRGTQQESFLWHLRK